MLFTAGKSPDIRPYTVHTYGSGQPYANLVATGLDWTSLNSRSSKVINADVAACVARSSVVRLKVCSRLKAVCSHIDASLLGVLPLPGSLPQAVRFC